MMMYKQIAPLKEHASGMVSVNRPNSDEHDDLFEKCTFFGAKALDICDGKSEDFVEGFEILVNEIGGLQIDEESLDRENLLIFIRITKLKNLIFEYLNAQILAIQADDGDSDDEKIDKLALQIKQLNDFLQEERNLANSLEKSPSLARKTAESTRISLFFVSIPVQSVMDLVSAANKQMDFSKNPNIRFVSSLMTNASFIINEFVNKSREIIMGMPERLRIVAEDMRKRTTITASNVANYLYSMKLKKVAPRRLDYSKEALSHELSVKREMLLNYLVDFRRWSPASAEDVFMSALFRLIFYGDVFYPYSSKAVKQISRDLNALRQESTEFVQNYITRKVEDIVDNLSHEIRKLETGQNV